jgi:hypothetical protein
MSARRFVCPPMSGAIAVMMIERAVNQRDEKCEGSGK